MTTENISVIEDALNPVDERSDEEMVDCEEPYSSNYEMFSETEIETETETETETENETDDEKPKRKFV